jgi:hypothetical protein
VLEFGVGDDTGWFSDYFPQVADAIFTPQLFRTNGFVKIPNRKTSPPTADKNPKQAPNPAEPPNPKLANSKQIQMTKDQNSKRGACLKI